MRFLQALLLAAALATEAAAQGGQAAGGQVNYPPLLVRDEGTDIGRATRAIDCVGTGITCTASAGVITLTASGGGAGANTVEVSIPLTDAGAYTVTVTGLAWVTGTSKVACTAFGTTADGLTIEQVVVSGLVITVSNYVAATGFNLSVFSPYGSNGTHRIHCTGA